LLRLIVLLQSERKTADALLLDALKIGCAMTRMSLIFLSIIVAGVIGLAPLKETGSAFQPAPLKTRSLAPVGVKPSPGQLRLREACASSAKSTCNAPVPGSFGPRG
jgi:hypothetical protein